MRDEAVPSVVDDVLNFGMDAVAKVASMALAGGQKLASLLRRLGLNAPFLDAGHDHIGMEYFAFRLGGSGWHDHLIRISPAVTKAPGHQEQISNAAFLWPAGTRGL